MKRLTLESIASCRGHCGTSRPLFFVRVASCAVNLVEPSCIINRRSSVKRGKNAESSVIFQISTKHLHFRSTFKCRNFLTTFSAEKTSMMGYTNIDRVSRSLLFWQCDNRKTMDGAWTGLEVIATCTGWAKKLRQIFLAITLVNMDRF